MTAIEKIRRALGRSEPLTSPPIPPEISEPIVRLVHTDIGMPELFAKRAAEQNMIVTPIRADDLLPQLIEFLRVYPINKIALADSPLLEKLNVMPALLAANFTAESWGKMTLDELY